VEEEQRTLSRSEQKKLVTALEIACQRCLETGTSGGIWRDMLYEANLGLEPRNLGEMSNLLRHTVGYDPFEGRSGDRPEPQSSLVRAGKVSNSDRKTAKQDRGKSDGSIVPQKRPNKPGPAGSGAEGVEGRGPAKGSPNQQNRPRAQNRKGLQSALERVREAALGDRRMQFTTLWHHVYNVERLREAYLSLKRASAPGVDGVTWQEYGENLEANLEDLSDRLRRGAYRARPVRRVHIPKGDGRQRPIGVPVLEDKIVQRGTVEVLNAVYEVDFLGFSYGFRPGRSPHDALDALSVGILTKKVNWVLDADISGFFDAIDHECLMRFIEHRIADRRVVRHIRKWLRAGVLEDGKCTRTEEGTPQGGSVSPLLANVYLHYVFDLWTHDWRKRQAHGDMLVVRYADDFIVGFQHHEEAEAFLAQLKTRLAQFGLSLHPEKTRLMEFGRYAAERRKRRGRGKPETFDFLGFTHICGRKRNGKFVVLRRTMRKRRRAKCAEIKHELRRRMHRPWRETARWLATVLQGHYRYYGVPFNAQALGDMRYRVVRLWYQSLRRRSQRTWFNWERMKARAARWLPYPRIVHPYPIERFLRRHPRQEPSAVVPHAGI
jgi:group II intron reverse transcriptase/maturase